MPGVEGIPSTVAVETMRWLTYLFFLMCVFATFQANSNPLVLDPEIGKFDLNGYFTFLRDPRGHLTLDDVANLPLSNKFIHKSDALNFAITADVIWLRFEVIAAPDAPAEWWLELAPAYIGEVTLYQVRSDGARVGTDPSNAGLLRPLSMRDFKLRHSTFRIATANSDPQTIYLRLRSNTQLNVRGTLWQPAFYAEQSMTENLLLGIYYGSFSLILGICGLRWIIQRNRVDLWWLVYLIAEGFVVFRMNGLAARYFLPEFPTINAVGGNVSLSVMVWAGAHFGIHAFSLDKNHHKYSYYAAIWIGNLALLAGLARLLDVEPSATVCIFILSMLLAILGHLEKPQRFWQDVSASNLT
jgi:hypothetical protein